MNEVLSKIALLRSQAPYIPQTMRLVWQATGMWMAVWLALLLVQGVLPVGIVYMTRQVVDSLVVVVKNGAAVRGNATYELVFPLVVLGALLIGEQILRSAGQWVRTIQSERVLLHYQMLHFDW